MRVHVYKLENDQYAEHPRDFGEPLGKMYTWHRGYTLGGTEDLNNQNPPQSMEQWLWGEFSPNLGDFDGYYLEDGDVYNEREEAVGLGATKKFLKALTEWQEANVAILDLYLYDHSGITIRTSPFSCPWDSGQVGFIWVTKACCEDQGVAWENAANYLESEIKQLDMYLTGDVWGYRCYEFDLEGFDEDLECDLNRLDVLYQGDNLISYYAFQCRGDLTAGLSDWLERNAEETDSCWGFYGSDHIKESCKDEAEHAGKRLAEAAQAILGARRRIYWCM